MITCSLSLFHNPTCQGPQGLNPNERTKQPGDILILYLTGCTTITRLEYAHESHESSVLSFTTSASKSARFQVLASSMKASPAVSLLLTNLQLLDYYSSEDAFPISIETFTSLKNKGKAFEHIVHHLFHAHQPVEAAAVG